MTETIPPIRRSNFDVTNTVDVTDPNAVSHAVESIFLNIFPHGNPHILRQAIHDIAQMYRGEHPLYVACDTSYHDLQHILDVTLASARLMDGYERSHKKDDRLGEELFVFGILMALFHDSGYLRKRGSEEHRRGAEFTLVHVSRSSDLLKEYLHSIGMDQLAEKAAHIVHYTGYEVPVERIIVPAPAFRAVGSLVATADMLAQMSDRCYLEKCHDRLYQEFLLGGITKKTNAQGKEEVIFASPRDLVMKTPTFYRGAKKRMDESLMSVHRYAESQFNGQNLYLEAVERNIKFAEYVAKNDGDIGLLQRTPPQTPGSTIDTQESADRKQRVEDRRGEVKDRRQFPPTPYPANQDRRHNEFDRRHHQASDGPTIVTPPPAENQKH
ncbi:MAG: hypothetical protein ACOY3V_06810 [Pseudomonadota bacterium]